ncbi:hypothetical protein MN032_15865 [Agromyces atrinae]|uniref:hypothetical protein n=1 Tax=Agromyces atrinae TaxID=592376 RepID=UPI001F5B0074|nr:hypothetical protein [Agromyces atrinae]MCI2959168.1 hypothetical protein [Agromyces atrinae]
MPRTSRWIAAALSLAVAVSLSACVTEPEPPPRTSSATPAPDSVFESDADALAAAIEAYEAYVSVSDSVARGGASDLSRFKEVATPEYAEVLIRDARGFQDADLRRSGTSTFDTATLAAHNDAAVQIYLCADVSETRVLNSEGIDITPTDRPVRVPLLLSFAIDPSDNSLLLESSDAWADEHYC